MIYGIDEREEVCANCKHFIQHYVIVSDMGTMPCNAGHCIHPRIKVRRPGQTCEKFIFKNTMQE